MQSRFKVGDVVYCAEFTGKKINVPCPICFGKLEVTVILGNGDQVITPCQFCEWGFEGPHGYITDRVFTEVTAIPREITGVDIRIQEDLSYEVTYWFSGHGLHDDRVAATYEEAVQMGHEYVRQDEERRQADRDKQLKYNNTWSYSRNVGYWLHEAKDLERRLERAREKARLCQEKVRKNESE